VNELPLQIVPLLTVMFGPELTEIVLTADAAQPMPAAPVTV
jgi:hypothetical protein